MDKDNRVITLIQLDSDRAVWVNFLDAVRKLKYKDRADFFVNPTGNPSAMFKAYAANDPKVKELRKKYNVTSFGLESVAATDFQRSHIYEAGNKVKIYAGGSKEIVATVVETSFGESQYKLRLTDGTIVHRNAHEMKAFLVTEDREIKTYGKKSLDEAILGEQEEDSSYWEQYLDGEEVRTNRADIEKLINYAVDDWNFNADEKIHGLSPDMKAAAYKFFDDYGSIDFGVIQAMISQDKNMDEALDPVDNDIDNDGDVDNSDRYLQHRRDIISREKGNMDIDEMVDEAMNMAEAGGGDEYQGRSNCCDAPIYGPGNDICSKCGEHAEVIPDSEEDNTTNASPSIDSPYHKNNRGKSRWTHGQDWSEEDFNESSLTEDKGDEEYIKSDIQIVNWDWVDKWEEDVRVKTSDGKEEIYHVNVNDEIESDIDYHGLPGGEVSVPGYGYGYNPDQSRRVTINYSSSTGNPDDPDWCDGEVDDKKGVEVLGLSETMGDAAYPICTKSVGSTAGTQKRSNWDADDKDRYDRCIDHLEEDELTEDSDPTQGMDKTELMSYDLDAPFQETELNEYKESDVLFIPLKSSFIQAAAYDPAEHIMYIRFKTGVYEYHKVPKNIFDLLIKAPSVGKFFGQVIKPNFVYNLAKKYKKRGAINTNPIPTSEMTEDDNDNYAQTGKYQSPERFQPNHDFFGEGESEVKTALETLSDDQIEDLAAHKGVEYKGREATILSLTDYANLTIQDIEEFKASNSVEESSIDDIIGEALEEAGSKHNMVPIGGGEFECTKCGLLRTGVRDSSQDEPSCITEDADGDDDEENEEMEESVTIEETFTVSKEDRDTMSYLAEAKGWKISSFTGLLKESKHESIVRIVCEKKGVTATITYDDDAASKPWTWEGRKFNFLQEALDTVFIPLKQALNEAVKKEKADIKSKEKQVKFLTERRGEAYKTTGLSKEEQAYRDAKGAEAFKKFMGDDLLKRGF